MAYVQYMHVQNILLKLNMVVLTKGENNPWGADAHIYHTLNTKKACLGDLRQNGHDIKCLSSQIQ